MFLQPINTDQLSIDSKYSNEIYPVPLHRTNLYHFFKKESSKAIIKENPLLQLMIIQCLRNEDNCIYYLHSSTSMAELLQNDIFINLPSIFKIINLLFSEESHDSLIGIDVQKLHPVARESFNELVSEGLIDKSLTCLLDKNNKYNQLNRKNDNDFSFNIYKIIPEDQNDDAIMFRFLYNPLLKYLLNNTIYEGSASFKIENNQEQLKSQSLINDLACLFDNAYLFTTIEEQWNSKSIMVSGTNKLNNRVKKDVHDLYTAGATAEAII